jgi:hypothetical protein
MDKLMSKRMAKNFGLIAVWIGLSQSAALACTCEGPASPDGRLLSADVVFAGKVIAEGKVGWWPSWINFKWSPPFIERNDAFYQWRTVFEVTTVWKGDIFAKTSVVSGRPCGFRFSPGEEYIVYAGRFEGGLRTGACRGNAHLSRAGEDLAAFGAGNPPAPNPSPHGAYIGRLITVLTLLSLLGWAALLARRKYGVQKS